MENLSKQNNIEEIKNKIKNLTPEQRAEKLKKAKEKQEKNKHIALEDKNSFASHVKVVVHEDFNYNEQKDEIDLQKVVKFEKNANFRIKEEQDNLIINLPLLQEVVGDADFFRCKNLKELPNLTNVGGSARFSESGVTSLPKLKIVKGDFYDISPISKLANIPCLKEVGGDVCFASCKSLKELPNLEKIGGYADFSYSEVQSLPKLTNVGGRLELLGCKIESLPNLQSVDGDISLLFKRGCVPLMPKLTKCKAIKIGYIVKTEIGFLLPQTVSLTLEEFRRIENDLRKCKNLDNFNRIMGKFQKPEQDRVR